MLCTKCGATNPDSAWECSSCRAPLLPGNGSLEDLNRKYTDYAQAQWRKFVKSPLVLIFLILQTLALGATLVWGLADIAVLIILLLANLGTILALIAMWRMYGEAVSTKPFTTKGIDMLAGLVNIIRWLQIIGFVLYVFWYVLQISAINATSMYGSTARSGAYTTGVMIGWLIGAILSILLINFLYKSLLEFLTGIQHTVKGQYPSAPKAVLLAVLQFLTAGVYASGLGMDLTAGVAAITPALMGIVILALSFQVKKLLPVYNLCQKQIKEIRDTRANVATEQTVNFDNLPTWKKVEILKQQEEAQKQQEIQQ